MQRLGQAAEFPHEIGLFLGYPPEDVQGFLENRLCKCVGCWKVYGDEQAAQNGFASSANARIFTGSNGRRDVRWKNWR